MKRHIYTYLYENKKYIKIFLIIYIFGILLGIIYFNNFDNSKNDIINYLNDSYNNFIKNDKLEFRNNIIKVFFTNFKTILVIWLIGFMPISIYIMYIIDIVKGFMLGYSLAALNSSVTTSNFIIFITLFSIPYLFKFINYLIALNNGINFNNKVYKNRFEIKKKIIMYILSLIILIMLSIIVTLIEVCFSLNSFLFLKKIV